MSQSPKHRTISDSKQKKKKISYDLNELTSLSRARVPQIIDGTPHLLPELAKEWIEDPAPADPKAAPPSP